MVLVLQKTLSDPALHLTTPHLINLDTDPKEREPYDYPHIHTWVLAHTVKLMVDYQKSVGREPLIPVSAPLDYTPIKRMAANPSI
jgi:arylsulfatase